MSFGALTNQMKSTHTSLDQEKFLAAKLLERSYLRLVAASVCEKIQQPKGHGKVGYFVRYKRMNVPHTTLVEGVPPTNSQFSLEEVTSNLDQWGDVITISDVAVLTTSHPLWQQAMELLLDNAHRLIDREVQNVFLSGTNVTYGNGAATSRSGITAAMSISDDVIQKMRVTMLNNGAPPHSGPTAMVQNARGKDASTSSINGSSTYVAICGPEVIADLQRAGGGLWVSIAQYQNAKPIYNGEMGQYYGVRWCETNFIPRFDLFGNTTTAVASGAAFGAGTPTITSASSVGGALAVAIHHWKVVRKDLKRGFEEQISIEHTTSVGAGHNSFTFAAPAGTDFAYNVYISAAPGGDANMRLAIENLLGGQSATILALPGAGARTAPANVAVAPATVPVHPIYVFGKGAVAWVGLQNLQTYVTSEGASKSDPLSQYRTMGYKFMGRTVILDNSRMMRVEVASNFS
jgi:N4-gp56 family major capsid protein